MKIDKKFIIIGSFAALVTVCTAATVKKDEPPLYTNLKVLPKNISSKDLQSIMVDDFQDGLGITCGFCHADAKDGHGLDFASDAKPEKLIARQMMSMTIGINKKYFKVKHPLIGSQALIINCNTCHKGQAFPDGTDAK